MKITAISPQVKNQNRVNISVDGKYRFSLDIFQVVDLGIRVGQEYEDEQITTLEQESDFGKVYSRALEYCLMRPRSTKEMRDYLYRKTRTTLDKNGQKKAGVSPEITSRVLDRLIDKKYVDDIKFAKYWVENRMVTKGASQRKLKMELQSKGIESSIIEETFADSERKDKEEIQKIINKKRSRYPDEKKFMMYLAGQGFSYDEIKNALQKNDI